LGLLQWLDSDFKALFGQDLPWLKGTTNPSKLEKEVNRLTQKHDRLLDDLRQDLLKAQSRMRIQVNKYGRCVVYIVS